MAGWQDNLRRQIHVDTVSISPLLCTTHKAASSQDKGARGPGGRTADEEAHTSVVLLEFPRLLRLGSETILRSVAFASPALAVKFRALSAALFGAKAVQSLSLSKTTLPVCAVSWQGLGLGLEWSIILRMCARERFYHVI